LREPEEVIYQVPEKYYHEGAYYDLQIAG
jgi:hypothetical protein